VPAKGAKLDLTLEVRDRAHAEAILASLAAEGYEAERIASGRVIE
jgi:threonine dehydratase